MIPRVQIEEELFTTAAAVRIDGQKTSSLSPLAACAGGRFLEYAAHLPRWLEQECNGAYTVTFCGGALEESILRMLFGRETACKGFSAAPGPNEMIRFEERLQYKNTIFSFSGVRAKNTDMAPYLFCER